MDDKEVVQSKDKKAGPRFGVLSDGLVLSELASLAEADCSSVFSVDVVKRGS